MAGPEERERLLDILVTGKPEDEYEKLLAQVMANFDPSQSYLFLDDADDPDSIP